MKHPVHRGRDRNAYDTYPALTQQTKQPSQFFRQQLVTKRIGTESTFKFRLNRVWDAGKAEIAQVAIEQRVNLVTVCAFQDLRPLQRGREEFQYALPHLGRELSACEQQAELILWGHDLTHDFLKALCVVVPRPSYTQDVR